MGTGARPHPHRQPAALVQHRPVRRSARGGAAARGRGGGPRGLAARRCSRCSCSSRASPRRPTRPSSWRWVGWRSSPGLRRSAPARSCRASPVRCCSGPWPARSRTWASTCSASTRCATPATSRPRTARPGCRSSPACSAHCWCRRTEGCSGSGRPRWRCWPSPRAPGRDRDVPRGWRSVVPWAVLGVLAAELAGLALWYSPFGWIGWGPRLTLPLVPPLLVLAVAFAGTGGAELLGRLLRGRGIWLAGAVVAVAGVTQLAFLDPQPVLRRFFRSGTSCVHQPIEVDPPAYYRCLQHLAWRRRPVLLDGLRQVTTPLGLVAALVGGGDGGGTAHGRSPRGGAAGGPGGRPYTRPPWRPAALTPILPSPPWSTASGRATGGRSRGPSRSSSRPARITGSRPTS